MVIDHVGAVFFPDIVILRIVGRIAFPIFCFLLVEGFFHTHDLKKYLVRLGIFAVLSEIPFDLALNGRFCDMESQNVFLTLFLGILMLAFLEQGKYEKVWVRAVTAVLFMVLAEVCFLDYGAWGLVLIYCFYITRGKLDKQAVLISAMNISGGFIQAFGGLSMVPIAGYNGKRGIRLKYLFYIFYPAHLMILYLIRLWMNGQIHW